MPTELSPEQIEFVVRYIGGNTGETVSDQADLTGDIDIAALADIFLDGKERATKSIAPLRAILGKSDDPDQQRIAEHGLNDITDGNSVALIASLHELRAAPAAKRSSAAKAVRACCSAYRKFLSDDPLVALCEDNPFTSGVSICVPLNTALDRIETALKDL